MSKPDGITAGSKSTQTIRSSPQCFQLPAAEDIPNHPAWPLLLYPQAVDASGPDAALAFEALFARNLWPPAWRNGVYDYAHFHTRAHEALGIYRGEVTVQFGGERGIVLTACAGDILVLPAGTGHRRLASSGRLGVVGAYPLGQTPDLVRPARSARVENLRAVLATARPARDPVEGEHGSLSRLWC